MCDAMHVGNDDMEKRRKDSIVLTCRRKSAMVLSSGDAPLNTPAVTSDAAPVVPPMIEKVHFESLFIRPQCVMLCWGCKRHRLKVSGWTAGA